MSEDSRDDEPPSQPKPSVTQPSTQQDQWDKENNYSERQIRIGTWLNVITIVSAVLAGCALIFLWDQIKMMKSSLQTTERAWITIKGSTIQRPLVAGENVPVMAGFYNSGHSPALHLTSKHFITVAPSLSLETMRKQFDVPTGSTGVIGPDTKHTNTVEHFITVEDLSNLTAQRANLYSFGIIEYTDIFDTHHWTIFCYRSASLSELNLVACPSGNDVDNN